ncbi:MAG: class I SAM-dependent rRNA methyltransferase [Planctomycetota bacterium JB042]
MPTDVAEVRISGSGVRRALLRHPWVYRDQVVAGSAPAGAVVRVVGPDRRPVGVAAWSPASRIALRFLSFGAEAEMPTRDGLRERFRAAVDRRASLLERTDAVRLVSSEADGFPGLIVDRYADAVVVQALTPFADVLLATDLTAWLDETFTPTTIVARNDGVVRKLEDLPQEVRHLRGDAAEVEVREGDLRFLVDVVGGQKTGFFLDQRANRAAVGRAVPRGARVLDAFTYQGGFALHAAANAEEVLAVDDSAAAVERTAANAARNGLENVRAERGNAFKLLRRLDEEGARFDVVVLDPPAFAKSRRDVEAARRGYHEINHRAMRLVVPGGRLVTASCSFHMSEPDFEQMLRVAARDARRDTLLLERRGQDVDHPTLLGLPESRYLKCFVLEML